MSITGRSPKATKMRATLNATKERRTQQVCRTYELKIDKSHLNRQSRKHLAGLFLEAKWIYNDLISKGDIWDDNAYKRKEVLVKNDEGRFELRKIQYLSASMRQEIVARTRDSIVSLSRLRKNNHVVGKLKFKKSIKSIPLLQYGATHCIVGANRIKIQLLEQSLRVRGLGQIPKEAEITNANLLNKQGSYFIHIVTFQPKDGKVRPYMCLGVDLGIRKQLTLSNGLSITEGVPLVTKKIRRLGREKSRRKLHGKNRMKSLEKVRRACGLLTNRRRDIRNKIVGRLVSNYSIISVQDDLIKGWSNKWRPRVTVSAIGAMSRAIRERAKMIHAVPRFVATTTVCSRCGYKQKLALNERRFECHECGLDADRDLNSAINIWKDVPAECREFTPVDTGAATEMMEYFNGIPNVSACLVVEAGSPQALVGSSQRNRRYHWIGDM